MGMLRTSGSQWSRQHPPPTQIPPHQSASAPPAPTSMLIALRKYICLQGDSTNAYLHAGMQDLVLIIIPEGFQEQEKLLYSSRHSTAANKEPEYTTTWITYYARLDSSGALPNRAYTDIGKQGHCFLLVYVDDTLLFGEGIRQKSPRILQIFQMQMERGARFIGHDLPSLQGEHPSR